MSATTTSELSRPFLGSLADLYMFFAAPATNRAAELSNGVPDKPRLALGEVVLAMRDSLHAGLFDNVLSDYLWARAVLLIGGALQSLLFPFSWSQS